MALMSIGRAIELLAARHPERVAVTCAGAGLTYAELHERSDALARAYVDLGVVTDDLVTVGLPNGVEAVVVCCAVWKAGATPQPVSPRLPPAELAAVLALAAPRLVVGLGAGGLPAGWEPPPSSTTLTYPAATSWKAPTSGGSTGRPKLVLSGSPAAVDPDAPTVSYIPRDAVQLVAGPLHHSAPFLFAMRGLFLGHTLVVLPRFDAAAFLAAVQEHRVTWTMVVPTMMQRVWRLPGREDFDVRSLQTVLHLGAPCPVWLKRAWLDWLGPPVVWEVYAGTEAAGVTLISGEEWLAHPGSVGRPRAGFEYEVRSPDGAALPRGEVGEIWMRPADGRSTFTYRGAAAATGWTSLGDLGSMDAGGWLYLADRSADVVLSGGSTVYPAEVEAVLDEHPQVRSSVVVGLPDDDLGERLHAVVDGPVTPADVLAWCRERLDPEKVPRGVTVVDEPLRDDAGKVRRSAVRALLLGQP